MAMHRVAAFCTVIALLCSGAGHARGPQDEARELLRAQPARVAAAVERLAPPRAGVTDVYFLGFAGFGEQRVFRDEVAYARKVLGERYGSAARSLLLVNDRHDRQSFPLATVANLELALELLGEQLDPAEDVLILFLSSHGAPDTGLAVTNGDLRLRPLRPQTLRRALDAAGIRWRVALLSACYSGAFVEPLRNTETLVLTAADAEHSSFGCDDERELTWFGEALLRDALPRAATLEEAFATARAIIERREAAEEVEHSNPQLFVGAAIRRKLAGLEPAPAR